MRSSRVLRNVVLLGVVVAAFALGLLIRGASSGRPLTVAVDESEGEEVVWTCSMHPQIRRPGPGSCPICGMQLIPEEAGGSGQGLRALSLSISESAKSLMEIETVPVERRYVASEIRMVGKVEYDETRLGYITAWVPGRLDKLHVDYTGITVRKDEHMVEMYSPELLSAQEELRQAIAAARKIEASNLKIMRESAIATVKAAREKLRLWGLTPAQIKEVEEGGEPADHITIFAPMGGTVVHMNAREGLYVKTGTRIYTIADLSVVWVKMDAYESDLEWLRYGQEVTITADAYPGDSFSGQIAFIDPVLDEKTRTVKVRVNVPNPEGKLKPEMFVHGLVRAKVAKGGKVMAAALAGKWICSMHPEIVKDGPGSCDLCGMDLVTTGSLGYVAATQEESAMPLVIPVSAALVTGTRAIVYVKDTEAARPTFEGREIVLGPRAGDYYIVRHGLSEGEHVVFRGNFRIDSALQIKAKPSMMTPEGGGGGGGHRHGGGEARKETSPDPGAGTEVPAAVLHQMHRVDEAYRAVLPAMRTGDLEEIKAAYVEFGKALDAVEGEALSGHAALMWKELAMLLGNDAFEGADVDELEAADRVLGLMKKHMDRLRGQFALGHAGHRMEPEATSFETPDAFRMQLGEVWKSYRDIHAALAGDEKEAASTGVEAMKASLAKVDMGLLAGDAHMAWMAKLKNLREALDQMAAADGIDGLRSGFAPLSEALWAALEAFATASPGPVYKLRCPMAFEGKGAVWLQRDGETRNPYYGAVMLRCGDVVETIKGEANPSTSEHEHE